MNDSNSPKPKHRWCRFSLRTLVIVVLVLGVFFGWLGSRLQRAATHRRAAAELLRVDAEIKSLGGGISYRYVEQPDWLSRMLGDPGVFDVKKVRMERAAEADLKLLQGLDGMLHSWELDLSLTGSPPAC